MTEYDFSPEAYERHLATQARIARWVDDTNSHSPENSFDPLPSDYESVASYPQNQATFAPHCASPHSQPLSPTYSYRSFDSLKRHKSKHGLHNTHRSRSLQPSPQFGQVVLPITEGLYKTAKQARLTQPRPPPRMTVRSPVRSSSTPTTGIPQTSHTQQYVIQPSHYPHPGSTEPRQMKLRSEIPQAQSPPYLRHHASSQPRSANHPFFRDPNASPTWTYSSLDASSVQSLLVSPTSSVPGVTFVQPNPHQPIVVPIQGGNGGYVVIPAAGQQVQVFSPPPPAQYLRVPPDENLYTSDEEYPKASFFGSLHLGKKKSLKQKNPSRQETKVVKRKNT